MKWLFNESSDVMVITTINIMNKDRLILYVSHDEDDGMWQFHDGYKMVEEDGRIISLKEVTEMDSSIMELHDLPEGWFAFRVTENSSWIRGRKD